MGDSKQLFEAVEVTFVVLGGAVVDMASEQDVVVHMGTLLVSETHFFSSFKERWGVLCPRKLKVFDSGKRNLLREIPLPENTVIEEVFKGVFEEDKVYRVNDLQIVLKTGNKKLAAVSFPTLAERKVWLQKFKDRYLPVAAVVGATGQGVATTRTPARTMERRDAPATATAGGAPNTQQERPPLVTVTPDMEEVLHSGSAYSSDDDCSKASNSYDGSPSVSESESSTGTDLHHVIDLLPVTALRRLAPPSLSPYATLRTRAPPFPDSVLEKGRQGKVQSLVSRSFTRQTTGTRRISLLWICVVYHKAILF